MICFAARVPNLHKQSQSDSDFMSVWNLEIVLSLYVGQL